MPLKILEQAEGAGTPRHPADLAHAAQLGPTELYGGPGMHR